MQDKNNSYEDGKVVELLPNTMFRIEMGDGRLAIATMKGKLRKSYVRIFPGDRVQIEFTPYDRNRGRIVRKY